MPVNDQCKKALKTISVQELDLKIKLEEKKQEMHQKCATTPYFWNYTRISP